MLISKRHSRIFFRSFISLALLGSTSLVGYAQSSASPPTGPETAPHRPTGAASITPGTSGNRFAISNGDLIEVSVYGVPELSQKTRVNSSGDLYMPLVGYIHVEGMTVADAQAAIEKRLVDGGFIKNPHVSLFTSEYAQGVSIMGEVNRPGVYPLVGSHNLLDLISTAQGLTPAAGRGISRCPLSRTSPSGL